MISFVGDVHGEWKDFEARLDSIPPDHHVIQVGDFAYRWMNRPEHIRFSRRFDFILGNHEYYPFYAQFTGPAEVAPHATYIPSGSILTRDGRRIGFLGGGYSIDRYLRVEGVSWFPEEQVSYKACLAILDAHLQQPIDLLVSHSPPTSAMIRYGWDAGFTPDCRDPSARLVEQLWENVGKPMMVCGHMHPEKVWDRMILGGRVVIVPTAHTAAGVFSF